MPSATCAAASARSVATARRWLRFEMPRRRGSSPAQHRQRRPARPSWPGRTRSTGQLSTEGSVQAASSVASAEGADERPAQVVDHLPARDGGDPARPARRAVRPAQDPGQELPVSACPAVLPCRGLLVARGGLVEELDVGDQARPGRRCPRAGRGSAACSRGPDRPAPARRRRCRRCPCRCRCPRRRGPGRRRRPRTRRGRCPRMPE